MNQRNFYNFSEVAYLLFALIFSSYPGKIVNSQLFLNVK